MTAVRQVARLGYDPRDVRHIVMTHLDFDHAGGLDDFPHATTHLLRAEHDAAVRRETWLDRQRFRPQQWSTKDRWRLYDTTGGEPWFGFERVHPLEIPGAEDVAMIPLVGHTFGHAGIAVRRADGWLLNAGDAYFHDDEMSVTPSCPPGLRFYQWMMEKDRTARLVNQRRLRALVARKGDEVTVFCGHDVAEFERLSGRSARIPADRLVGSGRFVQQA
jgi:glyoxylase-like metal-dependent hydrolase (beta-lactamase superfamily II)